MADERHEQRADRESAAATAIQVGATVLLGGGFYWGFVRQQRLAKREKLAPKRGNKPAPPVIRQVTAVERALRLDRPQSPGMAAFKALLGGTVMSVAGCALLVCGVGALLGVRSVEDVRERVERMLPRNRAPPRLLPSEARRLPDRGLLYCSGTKADVRRTAEFASEEEELNHIAKIFEEAVAEELRDQRKAKKQ